MTLDKLYEKLEPLVIIFNAEATTMDEHAANSILNFFMYALGHAKDGDPEILRKLTLVVCLTIMRSKQMTADVQEKDRLES